MLHGYLLTTYILKQYRSDLLAYTALAGLCRIDTNNMVKYAFVCVSFQSIRSMQTRELNVRGNSRLHVQARKPTARIFMLLT